MKNHIITQLIFLLVLLSVRLTIAQPCNQLMGLTDDLDQYGSTLKPFFEGPLNVVGNGFDPWKYLEQICHGKRSFIK